MNDIEPPLRAKDVADILGIHPHTLRRIDGDELPFFRIGKRGDRRYEVADVLAYKDRRASWRR